MHYNKRPAVHAGRIFYRRYFLNRILALLFFKISSDDLLIKNFSSYCMEKQRLLCILKNLFLIGFESDFFFL